MLWWYMNMWLPLIFSLLLLSEVIYLHLVASPALPRLVRFVLYIGGSRRTLSTGRVLFFFFRDRLCLRFTSVTL